MAKNVDKQALFEWLQKKAVKVQRGIEKSVIKAHEVSQSINQKIEDNPRAKATKELVSEFVKAQAERISDVRIHGRRVGDIPNAAQRLTERQLFKLMMKLREADPDVNWSQFIPDPEEMPIFGAFETLGLPYGTPFEEVRKTYRRLMREYHPDRHSDSPEAERIATEKTQELTAAYELIQQHYAR